ncbi:LPS-assembly protein LptD [Marinomonas ostreistagni]|uniref:LPS-assembly protein LptD n=1 Tax=Marinomonas ostreistagni TaxID=359209 RepID=UPI00194E0012|nr:LPS assembly protein LptD [Marinomonas ostreistagni]MBM6551510.1 LPS-assembly protein LptD [Marinomonas ostreistagni]
MPKHLRYYALLFQSLFILPMAQANEWDWIPRESLSESQQATLNQYCRGTYIDNWEAASDENTHLQADMIYRDEQGTLYMKGTATLRRPMSQLDAEAIEGRPNDYYRAQGDVALRTDGQLIRSQKAYVSSVSGNETAQFDQAKFLTHQAGLRGEAEQISRNQDGLVFIEEGFFTTCEPGDNSWQMYGSSIELDRESGFGTAKHVHIRIKDVPIFYFPWLRFPLDDRRQTGFLFPSFSFDGEGDLTLSTPFYWNIAPNYDATITPNIISRMGPLPEGGENNGQGADVEFRHLSPYGETIYEQSTFYEGGEEATLRKLQTDQQFTERFGAGLLYEDNPTPNREPEINTTSIGEKDDYERRTYARYNIGNINTGVQVRRYQTPDPTEDKPLEWKPRVDASYHYADQIFEYQPELQFTDFYEPDEVGVDGQRSVFNQDISATASNSWGSMTLGALHQYRDYSLYDYDTRSDRDTDINHLSYYLDTSVVFERSLDRDGTMWRQTLIPRFNYLYAPYENQTQIPDFDANNMNMTYGQAFSNRRFSGNDRIGDTEQVALGLESRFYDGNNINRWTLQGGQVFYLEDRRVGVSGPTGDVVDDTPYSAFLTSASYNGDNFTLSNQLNYDFYDDRVDLAQSALKYRPDNGFVFNVSFSYVREDEDEDEDELTKQASFGAILPLNRNWHFFHQQSYDWVKGEETAQVNGLGYENCCIKASLSYQRWRDDDDVNGNSVFDKGIFLQFILRSLSGVSRSNSDITGIADDYWNEGKVGY